MSKLGRAWVGAWHGAWWYTTCISEVGLGHWGRSGLVVMVMVRRKLVRYNDVSLYRTLSI